MPILYYIILYLLYYIILYYIILYYICVHLLVQTINNKMCGMYIKITQISLSSVKSNCGPLGRLARYLIIVVTAIWRTLILFQVPTEVPPEGGGAIHPADARHRRHGDTSGASHAVSAQSANMSQRPGHTQLRVSFDTSHTCVISHIRPD